MNELEAKNYLTKLGGANDFIMTVSARKQC